MRKIKEKQDKYKKYICYEQVSSNGFSDAYSDRCFILNIKECLIIKTIVFTSETSFPLSAHILSFTTCRIKKKKHLHVRKCHNYVSPVRGEAHGGGGWCSGRGGS